MFTSKPLIKKPSNPNINNELSYTQKCMILANIASDKKKILINTFDNMPIVKLYCSDLKIDNFVYSKIKGALCLLVEEDKKKVNYYLQIYEIKNFSLAFAMPITQKLVNDITRIENVNNFFCLPTKLYIIGFKFCSKDSMEKFIKILVCPETLDKNKIDMNLRARDFKCTYKEILKTIKSAKSDFEKKFKAIDSISGKIEKEKDKNIFQKLDELYYLINCIEFDEINKKFNLFVDGTFNPKIIQPYIDIYKKTANKDSLTLRIIFNDYTHIFNKKVYVDILINNLMNNFTEAKKLIIFKREHKKRHNREDFEESKRINSEYYISQSGGSEENTDDKFRKSAITPKTNFNNNINELKRKSNLAIKNVPSIKELPEEDVDYLKKFNEKEKKNKK